MSDIIKGYRVQGLAPTSPVGTAPAAGFIPRLVGGLKGRLPRAQVELEHHAAQVGAGALGAVAVGAAFVGAAGAAAVPAARADLQADLLARAQAKADLLVRQAEERAELLIDRAMNGAQALVEEARQSAWREGREEGLKQGREEAEALRREAEKFRAEALAGRDQLFAESREEVARLSLTVARQLLRQELSQDPGRILPLVDEALARVRGEDLASVRVNPTIADALEAQRDDLAARHGLGEVRVVADAGLEPGDVQVQTPAGNVDALVERQLGAISQTLTRVVRHV